MTPAATEMHDGPEPQHLDPSKPFDIHESYLSYVHSTAPLPPALASISALTAALSAHSFSTAFEAISLLNKLARTLKSQAVDPIPLSAGTDLYLHYLVTNIVRPTGEGGDFESSLEQAKAVGRRLVQRGLDARERVTTSGMKIIQDNMTVVVPGMDELVLGLLQHAAMADVDFRVVALEGVDEDALQDGLGRYGVPWTTIPLSALADTLNELVHGDEEEYTDVMVLAPAAALQSTGGIWASGTVLQAVMLAKALRIDVTVATEMMKLVRWDWAAAKKTTSELNWRTTEQPRPARKAKGNSSMTVTPAKYITQFVTEDGLTLPSAVAEEAINIWC